jgi:glycosyltransferase involved in cell wall biosynthesis
MRVLAVTNMYPTPRNPTAGTFIEQQIHGLRQVGLEVEVLFVDRLREGMRTYLALREKLRQKIAQCRPHIVHVMYGGVMAYQVTKTVGDRPTVVTFHGSDLLGEHLSGWLRKCLAGYGVRASRKAARRADRIVVVSQALQDALPADVGRAKVRIIPCGIDLERFRPDSQAECRGRLRWDPGRFHVLFPGHPRNGVKRYDLAQAAVGALSRGGIAAEMHALQGVPNADAPLWFNASDVVLLTSLHEGSPTVIKEALACDVPVVSVEVGDVRERIQGIAGCYLASPEPNDLAAKLRLVHDGARRVAGRVKVRGLSLRETALRLEELYRDTLVGAAQAVA